MVNACATSVAVATLPAELDAVLFDRDATLVVDDPPYNGDPEMVRLLPGVGEALCLLRAAGVRTGVVTNQSGVGRWLITEAQMRAVHARIDRLIGPFDTWQVCPHAPASGCECRKPAPGLVQAACTALHTTPDRVVVVGDIAGDIGAAHAAGAAGILVPGPATVAAEVWEAPLVAADLREAVELILTVARR